jgi:hypothetical protein
MAMKTHSTFTVKIMKSLHKSKKGIAALLLLSLLSEIIYPTAAYALTGGPSQPEVQGFAPVGTSDMVDLSTGDFNYNIPLMDIEGYPLNISYGSGVTMDQEASWVGLGWNLNPGVVNRNMRGIPDDFNGDQVTKEMNMKKNWTVGVNGSISVGVELFGWDVDFASLNFGIGMRYNSYNGFGIEQSVNVSLNAGDKAKGPLTGSLGITSSSDNGLSIQPSIGIRMKGAINDKREGSLGVTVGSSFNSRAGLQKLTVSANASVNTKNYLSKLGQSILGSPSASFDFGTPTYTPQVTMPMEGGGITASYTGAIALFGAHPNARIAAYYMNTQLKEKSKTVPAYGYMHTESGNGNSMLDFNRENDGSFTAETPSLSIPNYTFDTYSVAGQGIGGSYRPYRGALGHVFDPDVSSNDNQGSVGFEMGGGNTSHGGADINDVNTSTASGKWSSSNNAASALANGAQDNNPLYESWYFKEANEKSIDSDRGLFNQVGAFEPVRFSLSPVGSFEMKADAALIDDNNQNIPIADNTRDKRDKRNQTITQITRSELLQGYGLNNAHTNSYNAPGHHIGEIISTTADGRRYVYGIAAYNLSQREVTFALGEITNPPPTGIIQYNPGVDNSADNANGTDNYFSRTTTPAYAHSYLLTAVLSNDYVDSDNIKGPSIKDLGEYTKFDYKKIGGNYKWRTPIAPNAAATDSYANYNEGLVSDSKDNKGSYVYGEKELWYVDKIETKNYIAIFKTSNRTDGLPVTGENGVQDTGGTKMQKLDKIELYAKAQYDFDNANGIIPTPIKTVHFDYDYSLCQGIVNGSSGKLTLKKIYFTYGKSLKAQYNPYVFTYATDRNFNYDIKSYNRWGNYKPNDPTFSNMDFPYVDQSDQIAEDKNSSAWCLSQIILPSGGSINIVYESDDYAYVQNKKAMQMMTIKAVEGPGGLPVPAPGWMPLSDFSDANRDVFVLKEPGTTEADYGPDGLVYFRMLMDMGGPGYGGSKADYVSGYANATITDAGNYIRVSFGGVSLANAGGSGNTSPIVKSAIQFGRLNLSKLMWGNDEIDEDASLGLSFLEAFIQSNFISNIADAINGPNNAIYDDGKGRNVFAPKSFVRLMVPDGKKLGGGCRVKSIRMSDNWQAMANDDESVYGQNYSYTITRPGDGPVDDIISSGVATYEPQLGGDENPWRQPDFFSIDACMAPDDEHYKQLPYGESFFPSPSVGYSQVTVENIEPANVTHHGTGKVVHEFYTAKDFPTIVDQTIIDPHRKHTDKASLESLFGIDYQEYMTATQGFSVELNDMHGKPKRESVYQEDYTNGGFSLEPITCVEYIYKSEIVGGGDQQYYRLKNDVTAINPDGTLSQEMIGVMYDFVADFREDVSHTQSGGASGNLDTFILPLPPPFSGPWVIPMILPSYANEKTVFRSATTCKVINRFGILEKTVARDLGSVVSTKNLAYDSETGEAILTQVTNDYNDSMYSLTYPAHWVYDGMGLAYENTGYGISAILFNANGVANLANADKLFVEGDEVLVNTPAGQKGWVVDVTTGSIKVLNKQGFPIVGSKNIRVLRSGRRNMQSTPIATITALSNPLDAFTSNVFENVLQASAIEFSDLANTSCDCFYNAETNTYTTTNQYILGTKGNWRMNRSYTKLSPRSQTRYDNNTDIRRDGIMTTYTPFYRISSDGWVKDDHGWTYASEVTEYSHNGKELENVDALNRYSAATYSFNQSAATAVSSNAAYGEVKTASFEDIGYPGCGDGHFDILNNPLNIGNIAHTGRRSLKISSGAPLEFQQAVSNCAERPDCDLNLTHLQKGGNEYYITITSSPGLSISYDILSGNPTVAITSANTMSIVPVSNGSYIVQVTVVNAQGCSVTKIYTF